MDILDQSRLAVTWQISVPLEVMIVALGPIVFILDQLNIDVRLVTFNIY